MGNIIPGWQEGPPQVRAWEPKLPKVNLSLRLENWTAFLQPQVRRPVRQEEG